MKTLTTKNELQQCYEGMRKGDVFFKCLIATFWNYSVDFDLYGYALTNDIEEAKCMFLKELEDDEEATIGSYMVIWPVEYVGPYTNGKGQLCHAKGHKSEAIINDFGVWKTFKEYCLDEE